MSPSNLLDRIFGKNKSMAGKYKVQGGTSQGGEDLCLSCSRASIAKFDNNEEYKYCQGFDMKIDRRVVECRAYMKSGQPSLYDLRQIAWHITPEVKEKIGFDHGATVKLKVVTPADKDKDGKKLHHWHDDGLDIVDD